MILNLDMNKAIKQVTKADLLSLEEYSKNRKALRKEIVNYKKARRVPLGPYAKGTLISLITLPSLCCF